MFQALGNRSVEGGKVTVSAYDLPENEATLEADI